MMESSLFGSASLSKDFTPLFSDAASFFQQQQQQHQQLPQLFSQSVPDTNVLIICTKNHAMKKSNGKVYGGSKWVRCDLCNRSEINLDSFFYHCSVCQYDICTNCSAKIKVQQQPSTQSSTNNDAVINEIKDFYQLHNPDKLNDIDALLLKYTPTDLLQRMKEKYKKCTQPDLQPVISGSSPLSPSPTDDNSGTQFSSSGPSNKPSQVTFGQSTHATGFNISSSNLFSGTKAADAFASYLLGKGSQPDFKPKLIREAGNRDLYIQNICANDEYLQLSPEELQLYQSIGSPSDKATQSTTSSSVAANTITTADTRSEVADTRSQATSLLPSASEAWIKVETNDPSPVQSVSEAVRPYLAK